MTKHGQVDQYIKNDNFGDVSEVEYISCPVECTWKKELEFFHMLDSVKCDRNIRHIIEPILNHEIHMDMPKEHVHIYGKTNGNSLLLTGDNLQNHIAEMSSHNQDSNRNPTEPNRLESVTDVEYYSCPVGSTCLQEFRYLQDPTLKSLTAVEVSDAKGLDQVCATMNQLKTIVLYNTALGKLPDGIGRLRYLEDLTASNCGLTEIPDAVGNLKSLKLFRKQRFD